MENEKCIVDSKRIKVKSVTILEVDRENYEEIIRDSNMREYIDSVRDNVIVLKSGKIEGMKKELEKNKKFCILG